MTEAIGTLDIFGKERISKPRRRSRIDPMTGLCVAALAIFILAAVFAQQLAPYGFAQIDLRARNVPPMLFGGTTRHLLGTDELGRDILSRIYFGLRTSMLIALGSATISLVLGTTLGLVASFRRGIADSVIRVFIDFQASMPFLIIALAVLAFFGDDLALFIGLLGFYAWERYARLVRTMTSLELEKGYIAALRRNGAGMARISVVHVLPNILSVILVNLTVVLPEVLLQESALSFLGLGIQPPMVSLGSMVGAGRDYIMTEWWISVLPGVVIFVLSLTVSLLGDFLRDAFDPTLH